MGTPRCAAPEITRCSRSWARAGPPAATTASSASSHSAVSWGSRSSCVVALMGSLRYDAHQRPVGSAPMRAVGVTKFGGPEALEVLDLPDPVPGEAEVRIRVAGATVNPADTASWSGFYAEQRPASPESPVVCGLEIAGVIDAVGPGSSLEVGDRVASCTPSGHAELVVVPEAYVARVPDDMGLLDASTIPMNGLTARYALDRLALPEGATLVVTGAAGAVGLYAVELAALEGLHVVAVAGRKDEELVMGRGARTFVARGLTAPQRIRELFPDGVDGAIDAAVVGAPLLAAIRDGGTYIPVRKFDG